MPKAATKITKVPKSTTTKSSSGMKTKKSPPANKSKLKSNKIPSTNINLRPRQRRKDEKEMPTASTEDSVDTLEDPSPDNTVSGESGLGETSKSSPTSEFSTNSTSETSEHTDDGPTADASNVSESKAQRTSEASDPSDTEEQETTLDLLDVNIKLIEAGGETHTGCVKDLFRENIQIVAFVVFPKANTPGCTKQCKAFSAESQKAADLKCRLVGVSGDNEDTQKSFISKAGLNLDLICDKKDILSKALGCFDKKIVRSVVALRRDGTVCYEKIKAQPEPSCVSFMNWLIEQASKPASKRVERQGETASKRPDKPLPEQLEVESEHAEKSHSQRNDSSKKGKTGGKKFTNDGFNKEPGIKAGGTAASYPQGDTEKKTDIDSTSNTVKEVVGGSNDSSKKRKAPTEAKIQEVSSTKKSRKKKTTEMDRSEVPHNEASVKTRNKGGKKGDEPETGKAGKSKKKRTIS